MCIACDISRYRTIPMEACRTYIQHGQAPDKEKCVENVLQVAHQNHANVYGVLGIDLSSGAWTKDDVISYTQRAAQVAHVLQPIIHQLDQYHYDGLVKKRHRGRR